MIKVGDKYIIKVSQYGETFSLSVKEVSKVNKATFKIDNSLFYIETLRKRGRNAYGPHYQLLPYSSEKYAELKAQFVAKRYKRWVDRMKANRLLDIDMMEIYIREANNE